MTLQEIANEVGQTPVSDVAKLADLIFDAFATRAEVEVDQINVNLMEAGVDCTGICKRKHPPAPH